MKIIDGGVCAAKGFKAGSVRCGIKASRTNDDTAIIFSECECNAAATYTMNRVKAAPVYVTMEHLENGVARAIVANSGNANACAPDGMENARRMAPTVWIWPMSAAPWWPSSWALQPRMFCRLPPALSASASILSASRSICPKSFFRTTLRNRQTVQS